MSENIEQGWKFTPIIPKPNEIIKITWILPTYIYNPNNDVAVRVVLRKEIEIRKGENK